MELVTPQQCRASRSFLNWSQPDLAKRCGVHIQTICHFENESGSPTQRTLTKITDTLKNEGIELLGNNGVRLHKNFITTYEGPKAHRRLLDEIYNDLKDVGGEILIKGLTERKWEAGDDGDFLRMHIKRLQKANLRERLMISDNDTLIVAPRDWYKKVPAKYFSLHTQWIYGDKVAMVTWGEIEKVVVIKNQLLAEAETRAYNCIWENVAEEIK